MSKEKKVPRHSLENVRPQPDRSFTLGDYPDAVFEFKIPDVDDESWVKQTFGRTLGQMFQDGEMISSDDLARVWFRHLPLDAQKRFPMTVIEVMDEQTGEVTTKPLPPWKTFQKAIKIGVESLLVMVAFKNSFSASRPLADLPEQVTNLLPDDLKKKITASRPATATT